MCYLWHIRWPDNLFLKTLIVKFIINNNNKTGFRIEPPVRQMNLAEDDEGWMTS